MPTPEFSAGARHRGYALLLASCIALITCLMLPTALRPLVALGYTTLPLVLVRSLGSAAVAGRWGHVNALSYRLLGGVTLVSCVVWYATPLIQRKTGLPLLFLMALLVLWSCQRLISNLAVEPRVNRFVLMGALAGYLLLGLAAGLLFSTLETMVPGSFVGGRSVQFPIVGGAGGLPGSSLPVWSLDFVALNYFAFVTLTTTGYGDIHPATSQAQMVCALVAMSGTLYLALVMGLLISRFTAEDVEAIEERERR